MRAGLIFDTKRNLYGTTVTGGEYGWGTVFQLKPGSSGQWSETVLHSFKPKDGNGNIPNAGVVMDRASNLYGSTTYDGNFSACSPYGSGVVYKLALGIDGPWNETVLHAFDRNDGEFPYAPLTF